MKNNRIFLLTVGFLASIFILEGSIRAASPFFGPPLVAWNTMEDAKRLKLAESSERYPTPAYLIMGNSTSLIGFNPTIFDAAANLPIGSSFNAAMNGSDIKTIRDFSCDYIVSTIRPKNLVLLFSNIGMIQNGDYKAFRSTSANALSSLYLYQYRNTFRDPMTVNTLFRVLKYRDKRQGLVYRWADNLDEFGYTKYVVTNAKLPKKGWNPREDQVMDGVSYRVSRSQLKHLIEIRDLAKKNGVKLLIGTVPLPGQDLAYRGTIRAIAEDLGVGFVQGNDALGEGRYFQDEIHLNKDGARVFSEFLAKELMQIAKGTRLQSSGP
jgi:hypothetical protein